MIERRAEQEHICYLIRKKAGKKVSGGKGGLVCCTLGAPSTTRATTT